MSSLVILAAAVFETVWKNRQTDADRQMPLKVLPTTIICMGNDCTKLMQ